MEDLTWYKDAIFYEVYVRAFCDSNGDGQGDLIGLTSKLDYLQDLGVTCLWLLPIYPSPMKDDGYDIADFYNVHPTLGSVADFKRLVEAVHARGMRMIIDLVMNHTSDQHPWFQAARKDRNSPYRDYYVWSDTDQKFTEARIIFLDTEASNWTYDEVAGQYYWHRFYSTQPDLNYDNPAVQQEMVNVMKFWLDLGIDGFRADAVPYIFEQEDTNCENLPETHVFLKQVRQFLKENYPDRVLLAEANQWPEDVLPYFGNGSDEFQMGFHFPLMPRMFMALRSGDVSSLKWILGRTPALPGDTQWGIFLRNHDELTLEMVTEEERQWMWQEYAPEARMRLNLGIRRRLAPLLDGNRKKIELAYSLLFTMPGSPINYYGDEIGMGDNIWLFDRNGLRTPMQWDSGENGGFSGAEPSRLYSPLIDDPEYGYQKVNVASEQADPDSLLNQIRRMIGVRRQHKAFSRGSFEWAETGLEGPNEPVADYIRVYQEDRILVLQNLSAEEKTIKMKLPDRNSSRLTDILSGELVATNSETLELTLAAYEFRWLAI